MHAFLQVGTVDLLLQNGADRESQDIEGRSAVELATHAGRKTVRADDVRLASKMLDQRS